MAVVWSGVLGSGQKLHMCTAGVYRCRVHVSGNVHNIAGPESAVFGDLIGHRELR